ncbi:siphovirus Gp157 family protein [Shouchella clausii]|uniref:siphovirus Gp157 family protein n=1 Tax=Shouchella clausii TaxID=79880 RepID=UPI001C739B12|nr:siphovirus Gp157 family protein [Shouchella clausii]MBX0320232.1 siphovirus Gp157 family protein [Shouchella clausii]MEB5480752.1 siphovirus Gp157 family protein [Shouchella clausii]
MAYKLYELSANLREFLDKIDELEEGEILSDEAIKDTLESLTEPFDEKIENIAKAIKTMQYEAEVLKAEKDRLEKRRKSVINASDRLKEYMQANMEAVDVQKVKGLTLTVNIQNNPPSVLVEDESAIPEKYLIEQNPKIDKKSILEDFKNDQPVPGCTIKRTRSIRIR